MREIARAENLVNLVFITGSIIVAIVALFGALFGFQFFTWHNQHKKILSRLKEWEQSLEKVKMQTDTIIHDLRLPSLLDLKLDEPKKRMKEWIDENNDKALSIERITERIYFLRIFCDLEPEVFLSLGHYFRYMGNQKNETDINKAKNYFIRALECYEEALKYRSSNNYKLKTGIYQSMAVCLEELKRFEESADAASKAIIAMSSYERHYLPYDSLGIALLYSGHYAEAIKNFQIAFDLCAHSPHQIRPRYNLACANAIIGDEKDDSTEKQRSYKIAYDHLAMLKGEQQALTRIRTDPDLDGIRTDTIYGPKIKKLIQ